MSADSKIGWLHRLRADGSLMPGHTFNAWWGCTKVARECDNCYAESLAKRYGFDVWGPKADRRFFGDKHWNEPLKWDRAAAAAGEKHLVFTNSQADVLEDRLDLIMHRMRLTQLVEDTPHLIWLFLTKRTENQHLLPKHWTRNGRGNVWFGGTTGSQKTFDQHVDNVRKATWAARRFLSIEPMLSRVNVRRALGLPSGEHRPLAMLAEMLPPGADVDWFIIGGESGVGKDKRHELDLEAAEEIASEAASRGKAVYVKQDSHFMPGQRGRLSDRLWALKQHPSVG